MRLCEADDELTVTYATCSTTFWTVSRFWEISIGRTVVMVEKSPQFVGRELFCGGGSLGTPQATIAKFTGEKLHLQGVIPPREVIDKISILKDS